MHYQISRNGQSYGPYTFEDLGRYVASGNILPTDLAKSEEMGEWVPVSQVLAGQAGSGFSQNFAQPATPDAATTASFDGQPASSSAFGSSGYTNPVAGTPAYPNQGYATLGYGQPAPAVLNPNAYPDAPNLNWGLLLLLDLLTCRLFQQVWNIVVAAWLRRVQPNATSLWYYLGYTVLSVIQLAVVVPMYIGIVHSMQAGANPAAAAGMASNPIGSLIGLLAFAIGIVARFVQRANLQEHFNTVENVGLQLNPVMVFFFGGLYFQYHLNKINAYKQQLRNSSPGSY